VPLHEYLCDACGARVEMLVRDGNADLRCPHCDAPLTHRLLSVPNISKGLASREPGHTCCGREERCDAPPCSEGGGCRRG
jgi:putative FmdB family regulatory protein